MSNEQLRNMINTLDSLRTSSSITPELSNDANAAYDSIEDYNKDTNTHRKKVFDLVIKEIEEKIELRKTTYNKLHWIFMGQLIISALFLVGSAILNYCSQKSIVSDKVLIAVVVTLTGSFLTFMGVAHKYIFSSSQEFFDYAKSITLHQNN